MKKVISALFVAMLMVTLLSGGVTVSAERESEEFIPVYTIEDLYNIRNDMDANYRLMNDIDLTEATAKGGDWDFEGRGWNPIGSNNVYGNEPFTGIFDGDNHTVKGMRIEITKFPDGTGDVVYIGLFANVSGEIKNLNMEGGIISVSTSCTVYAGSVGGACNAIITNCSNNGLNIHFDSDGNTNKSKYVGGICGKNVGLVSGCWNTGDIYAYSSAVANYSAHSYAGGIVGTSGSNKQEENQIIDCYNYGKISSEAISGTSARCGAGGIVGELYNGTINRCYNTGTVEAVTNFNSSQYCDVRAFAGGIAGEAENGYTATEQIISNSYNIGIINTKSKYNYAGGIAGTCQYVVNCYNIGEITEIRNEESQLGNGIALTSHGTIDSCYYLNGSGNSNSGAAALTETQMKLQSLYQEFDFENVWIISKCSDYPYPQLRNNMQSVGNHVFGEWKVRTPATCTEKGEEYRTCICGAEETKEIPALGHAYSEEWTIDKEATCRETGEKSHHCTRCDGRTDVTEIEALGHSYTKYVSDNNATCTENGTETAKCDRCEATDTREAENSALGHAYSEEWTVDKEATCEEVGEKSHHCTRCDDRTDVTEIEALGHSFTKYVSDNNFTCTENGTETAKCDRCEITDTREMLNSALGHSYTTAWTIDKEPTCAESGEKSRHCIRCNDRINITEIPVTDNHNWGAWTVKKRPSCTKQGEEQRICSVCHCTDVRDIGALGHDYSAEWTIDKEPTCTEEGSKAHYCTRCDVKTDVTPIPANGHTYGKWETVDTATCTDKGSERRICMICHYVDTRDVDATGHAWSDEYTVDKAPTCAEDGSKSVHCLNCEAVKDSEVIPATGHEWKETSREDATCITTGQVNYVCVHDGTHTKQEIIQALGHAYSEEWTVDKEATCEEAGEKSHHCTRCGDRTDITEIPMAEHSFGEWQVETPATTEQEGREYRTCSACGEREYRTIPVIIIYGDADGDGEINMKDIVLMRQYIANYDYEEGTSSITVGKGADANGDGQINMSDIVLLRQYIANYDYETGSSTVILGPEY